MKAFIIWTVLAALILVAARQIAGRCAPAIRERCSEACERMLAHMPESFPPNRMMADLGTLKEQTAQILDLVESRADEMIDE